MKGKTNPTIVLTKFTNLNSEVKESSVIHIDLKDDDSQQSGQQTSAVTM